MTTREITNAFVRDYARRKQLTVKVDESDEQREWGGFYILEAGPNYDVKILWVKPRKLLSLQAHGDSASPGHHEIWTALTNVRIIRGQTLEALRIIDRTRGGIVTIPGGVMHSLANPFREDHVYVYEVRVSSASETPRDREDRIRRIYDVYQRGGTPPYPEQLLSDILDTPFDPRFDGLPLPKV